MSRSLTIVARIKAKPGQENTLAAELAKLVPPTLLEAGCLQYDLHRDLEDPGNFLFFENWETKEQWLAHMESPQLLAYKAAADDLVDVFELFQMEKAD
ncbi:MAG: antibiotic biosynthesis monooxygenase [Candidatus Krumholzibacteria bacterium]|nr:antibiotic biosynthesis monooxygenase [Candidatus Krumholzibacteria bacterium]